MTCGANFLKNAISVKRALFKYQKMILGVRTTRKLQAEKYYLRRLWDTFFTPKNCLYFIVMTIKIVNKVKRIFNL